MNCIVSAYSSNKMVGLKVLWLFLSVVLVKGSPFFSNSENELSNLHDAPPAEKHEEPDVYRLTDEVVPKSYELRIVPDFEKFIFTGRVEIQVHAKFTTNKIILHAKKLTIKSVKVMKSLLLQCSHKLDESNDLLIITTAQPLNYDTDYTVVIDFEGVLNDDMRGFYRSSYSEADGKIHWMATTQFEPTYAREAFPCFDEPRFRASFTIYLARSNDQIAISNMPSEAQLPPDSLSGNRLWEKFVQSPPMATYLVAFMVTDQYSYMSDAERKIRVFVKKSAVQQSSYALKQSSQLLKQLEGYTGIAFKLPKLDVVAVPDFNAGAMENWGMTTFRERYIMLNEPNSCEQQKTAATEVISHEFAHQWFGDLVTPAWWDFLWLNEGFATYFETFAAAAIEPFWKLDQLFVVETVQFAMKHEITTQRAMTSRVNKFSQIKDAFDVISYDKAGSVIRMFEHIFSPNIFRNALHLYLQDGQKNYDGTVTQKVLFDAFDKVTGYSSIKLPPHFSASDIMKTWTENIGYPVINIARCYHHGEVTVKQATYKSPRAPKPLPDQEWIVPLTYTTKSAPEFSNTQPTYWSFAGKPTELTERFPNSDWIIFNLQQSGYYRVNYDSRNWEMLIDQLHQDPQKIHVLNRAQLIDDTGAFADDGISSYYLHLHLLQYLSKETDMIAWYSAITSLNKLISESEGTPNHPFIKEYVQKLIHTAQKPADSPKTPYENFGFEIKTTDDHVTKIVKPMFLNLACKSGVEQCIQQSLDEYKKNEADLSKIQPDLKKVVYCNALRNSKDQQTVFNNLWNTYLKTEISFDKNIILTSLSCTSDEGVIKNFLKKMIDPKNTEVRKQDAIFITRTFTTEIPTVTAILKILIEEIPPKMESDQSGPLTLQNLVDSINVKTPEQAQLLEQLATKSSSLNQKKYSDLISSIKSLNNTSSNKIEKRMKISERIKEEYNSPDKKPDKPTEKPPQPGSGASALVPKLWWHLVIAGIVLCYGAPRLRTL
ncbi:aminopeptidase N-like [Planococcus citri]|uniref:aminopeptidase N-like n=1 Tax=Planococcus citri TaxID=170843 RepID=UPI0031F827DC